MYQFAVGLGTGLFAGLLLGAGLIWCFTYWADYKKSKIKGEFFMKRAAFYIAVLLTFFAIRFGSDVFYRK